MARNRPCSSALARIVALAAGDGARSLLPSEESAVHAAVETLGDSPAPRRGGRALRGAGLSPPQAGRRLDHARARAAAHRGSVPSAARTNPGPSCRSAARPSETSARPPPPDKERRKPKPAATGSADRPSSQAPTRPWNLDRQPVGVEPAGRSRNRGAGNGDLRQRDLLRDEGHHVALSRKGRAPG